MNVSYDIDFNIVNDWGRGFTANVVITNTSDRALDTWTLAFDAPFEIANIWSATISSYNGDRYIIENAHWNGRIAPGQSITIGFNGRNPDGVTTTPPSNYSLNGDTPLPPLPDLSVGDLSLVEGSQTATFTIALSAASEQVVSVDYATLNGTATAGEDYLAAAGTATFAPGEIEKTITVTLLDDASYEGEETFTLQLSDPTNARLNDPEAIATIADNDPAPISDTPVQFVVTSDWGTGFVAQISITNNGTQAISDWSLSLEAPYAIAHLWNAKMSRSGETFSFEGVSWNRAIAPGQTVSFGFKVADAAGLAREPQNLSFNDTPVPRTPQLSIRDTSVSEGNNGTTLATFAIELSEASEELVSVSYATANGTAIAGEDYQAMSGTLTFAPGETRQMLSIPVFGDLDVESNETFLVELAALVGAEFASDRAVGTINNDDFLPSLPDISIRDASVIEGNNGTTLATFAIELSEASEELVSVSYATANGTAIAGEDYQAASGTLTFAPGATRQMLSIPVFGDLDVESDETFLVELAALVGAEFASDRAIGTIKNDDVLPSLPDISIRDAIATEGDLSSTTVAVTVALSEASNQTVAVNYATLDGEAIAGEDYRAVSGTLTFAPGETSQTLELVVLGDTLQETNETFSIVLSAATNGEIADGNATVTIADNDSTSTGMFNYGEALQLSFLFYEAQRSGALPDDNRIEWRGDSALNDGADVGLDLSGGYYDAGDHVKFGFPMAASMTMLAWGTNEYRAAYEQSGQIDESLDAIRWATDYILAAHVTDPNGDTLALWGQVGDGFIDHARWNPPEAMTEERPAFKIDRQSPGSDLAGETAATLAAAAIAFRSTDPDYADRLLENAEQLYEFADTYRGKYSDSIGNARSFYNSWSGYQDELAWGAIWLYKATGDSSYLSKAESAYNGVNTGWTHNWDDKSHGTAILLAQETGAARYRNDVENWLNRWSDTSGAGINYTDGGLAWLDQWGSLRYAATTAFLAGVYSDTVNDPGDRYSEFARSQIDYILGDNPLDMSYQIGFGDHYPLNPHHRGSHGGSWATFNSSEPNENILFGALVGGPASANDFDYIDDRTDYIRNEVALDYNAGFTGALAYLYNRFGGDPLSDAELDALPGIAIGGE